MITEERRTRNRLYMREYSKTENYKKTHSKVVKLWNSRNAIKRKAHLKVGYAVASGRLIKPELCSQCGGSGKIHAHHEDYTKPLDVVWACDPCHKAIHKGVPIK